jgi:filamentous hemagglutinin family protein
MNHIHRVIWSRRTGAFVVAPESAKSGGKGGSVVGTSSAWASLLQGFFEFKPLWATLIASGMGAFLQVGLAQAQVPAVHQLPTGGQVAAGVASIAQANAVMGINQSSAKAVINWQTFDVGSQAKVNIVQPSSNSFLLNRVQTNSPSQIFGQINANGQVILVNPSGIYFSPTARVDVGGLVATTHSIADADFMAGSLKFNRNGATASVVNEGSLSASLGGYIALLAPEVRNTGVVVAQKGTVALAAGQAFELQFDKPLSLANVLVTPATVAALVENGHAVEAPGGLIILSAHAANQLQGGVVKNSGSLKANALVQRNGRIVLSASDQVNVSGQLQVNSDSGKAGQITLTAEHISLQSGAQLQAMGASGGGTVLVGGDWQGSGNLRQATTVSMQEGASIDASATQNGDGGKVVLWSDIHNKDRRTEVRGSLTAQGGAHGGNGGNVETSGASVQIGSSARVDTFAAVGKTGNWLIDPLDFTIAAGTGAQTTSGIGADTLTSNLGGNTDITISTSTGTGSGNIDVNSAVSWSKNKLTLTADPAAGVININANLNGSGTGSLALNGVGVTGSGEVSTGAGVTFNTSGTSTYSGIISAGSVTKSGAGTLTLSGANTYTGGTTLSAGSLQISANNNTGAGGVSLTGGTLVALSTFTLTTVFRSPSPVRWLPQQAVTSLTTGLCKEEMAPQRS